MSVYSMTGYASAQHSAGATSSTADSTPSSAARLGLEIRSVNSRYLDLTFKLSEELRGFEPALRELLVRRLKRGKVEVRAALESNAANQVAEPSARLLQRLNTIQDNVRTWLPLATPLSVADVIRLTAGGAGVERDWQADLLALAEQVLQSLMAAREREGARLVLMLQDRMAQLRSLAAQAQPLVPQLVAQQRQRFLDRWRDAMGLVEGGALPEAAQDRALAEATAFAIRIDVAEELTRLSSHLDELERLLAKGGEVGKRLDFLIQELHREANTLGSKSAALELTHISVDMKVLIEQMREQVQNIE
ncbi:YicC/YloC family endoribonuclease [Rhodoferax sp.]|uniref:YicC/YloC family endoribonuclease n=1 Tax=Rhodoferax sp. TaxID=50421 RepID=UPI002726AC64|nr:YicC/YloC family endoribonuclease [Rhodoferax sp.]MDO9144427.1 YicC/YloC family endoribonuclease [Rhodoferax sp.]MDP1530815.1 YicC/YloC family endoribonuclease [Rhodoferax sp.]MDP1945163.1 YicC/YloC family endoribonuclease [Rhodoferax sp.]MDP2442892.1 YicC/YloC family endoribonuclease [Rhodoferax sp.]MDP3191157.1 YicC/YloC family endoribonuclease [Rhodoferax sp.]